MSYAQNNLGVDVQKMATESQKTMRWHFSGYKQAALQGP
ncbi:Uncharacterised protein [Escherichia coli]|uniref:Uncharacterized protein n=1 Tax=Escherichia coli TaxID=562 RepID=A0A2X1N103_ECOLX|nr:Uncharacterised protein [Escherichia coli]